MDMALPEGPQSRAEQYLAKIAGQAASLPEAPRSRVEQYLDYIAENGTVSKEEIAEQVSDWLSESIHEDPTVVIDKSLSIEGAAADAKAVGDTVGAITNFGIAKSVASGSINDIIEPGIYLCEINAVTDLPEGVNGTLVVFPSFEIFRRTGTVGVNDNKLYHRRRYGDGWASSWWQISETTDMIRHTATGDVLTSSDDLNAHTSCGTFYWTTEANTPVNAPHSAIRGRVEIFDTSGNLYINQLCFLSDASIHFRQCTSVSKQTWTVWKPLVS